MINSIKEWYFKKMAARSIEKHGKEKIEKLAVLNKPAKEWRVSFLTTAGVHLKDQTPFDVDGGDWGVRMIPSDSREEELMVTHTHYDTASADQDINCVYPSAALHALTEEGHIGGLTPTFFGMMGYIPRVDKLMNESVPLILKKLKEEKADVVLLSPG
ncbi:glycine/betaine/sarcosine/D-proline family reductase selenoprotein B [Salipaludibacillus sp. CUR1]|uniref:glycine/sarcosine/betaine reductase selenoprotein B family protein n=1 Tax=Salipaludibacillus sp. CUR1 TaxID=2820003 RepID=UPI001E4079A8|nr:glycine/sarcosine/betaine reductase selenoprotein B family protein [Salipaludibacillus sp. CUR1]MCE7793548.1 glycine/betaine/sarcosine/D-proline family reductase selenoprotein B [Salipaludibacillus sp. CUR1]